MYSKHPLRASIIYSVATLFLVYEMALQVSPSVITNQLMGEFGIGAGKLGLMASFYFYSYSLMQIPAGMLIDRLGPRRLVTFAAIICALGSYFFGGTETVSMAALGRFLMGFGSSFAFIAVLVIAARWFSKSSFAFFVGIGQFLGMVGALCGELPLSYAVDSYGWRAVMLFLGFLGLGVAIIALICIRDFPPRAKLDYKSEDGMRLLHKLREILTRPQTYAIAGYAFCSWGPVAAFAALWGIPFLVELHSISSTHSALAVAMIFIGSGLSAPFLGWFSDLIGRRCLPLQICSLIGLVTSIAVIYLPIPFWLMCIALFGFGVAGSGQIVTFGLVRETSRPSMTGAAVGLNNMAVVAGGAIIQPLIGAILALLWKGEVRDLIPYYTVGSYQVALLFIPICFVAGWILSTFFVRETYCKTQGR